MSASADSVSVGCPRAARSRDTVASVTLVSMRPAARRWRLSLYRRHDDVACVARLVTIVTVGDRRHPCRLPAPRSRHQRRSAVNFRWHENFRGWQASSAITALSGCGLIGGDDSTKRHRCPDRTVSEIRRPRLTAEAGTLDLITSNCFCQLSDRRISTRRTSFDSRRTDIAASGPFACSRARSGGDRRRSAR